MSAVSVQVVVAATRDWTLIWSLVGAAAVLTLVGLVLLLNRR